MLVAYKEALTILNQMKSARAGAATDAASPEGTPEAIAKLQAQVDDPKNLRTLKATIEVPDWAAKSASDEEIRAKASCETAFEVVRGHPLTRLRVVCLEDADPRFLVGARETPQLDKVKPDLKPQADRDTLAPSWTPARTPTKKPPE